MPSTPVAVVDALNSLLESQQRSIIRFMGEGSPYLTRATADVRQPLHQMLQNNLRRCEDLYRMVEKLGGTPRPRNVEPEEQYLAYLSLKFLLPKLVDAKELIIRRYENALRALGKVQPDAIALLQRHLADHQAELRTLRDAAAVVAQGKDG